MSSSDVRLSAHELRNLQVVITHGLKNFFQRAIHYEHRRGDLNISCSSLEYEYVDNNRLIYRLFQEYGPNFMDTFEKKF
jgi:hypothetical protein